MSASSTPTPDGEPWTGEYVSSNGASAEERRIDLDRIVVLGYITSVALPVVGLVIGIAIALPSTKQNSRHGPWIIALSIIAAVVWVLVLTSSVFTSTSTGMDY